MSKTELSGKQVKDGSVQRVDLDVSTSGQAVTTKIVAGDNISLSSTGVDAGTGDVTVSLGGTIASDIASLQSADTALQAEVDAVEADVASLQSADTTLQANIDAEESARIAGDASTLASAQSYADTAVAGIVNSAPETLDTLNELAAALGDDPNFATTISTQIGLKADSSSLATVATSGDYNDLINTPSAGASDLDGLSDVTLTSSASGEFLKYSGSGWVNSNTINASASKSGLIIQTASAVTGEGEDAFLVKNSSNATKFKVRVSTNAANNYIIIGDKLGIGSNERPSAQISAHAASGSSIFQMTQGVEGPTYENGFRITYNGTDVIQKLLPASGTIKFYTGGGNTNRFQIASNGLVTSLYGMVVNSGSDATKALIVKGSSSQTANLLEIQNSAGTAIANISAAGEGTFNTVKIGLGTGAVETNTAVGFNTLEGYDAGVGGLWGRNVALGYQAGASMSYSVAIGYNALRGTMSAGSGNNVAVGSSSLSNITTGTHNVYIGSQGNGNASACTTGASNVAIGSGAYTLTTVSNSIAIGRSSSAGASSSTVVGYSANSASTAPESVVIGKSASASDEQYSAGRSVAIGSGASATGADCVALGFQATSGYYGLAIGRAANAAANCLSIRFGNANRIIGDANGQIGINEAAPGAQLQVTSGAAARKGLIVKGAASQTANLFETQNSAGTTLFSVDKDGSLSAGTIPVARVDGLSTVATSGDYNDLINTPSVGASDLDGLSDVTLTSSASGEFLKYNGTNWVNSSLPEASSSVAGIVTTGTQTFAGKKNYTTSSASDTPLTITRPASADNYGLVVRNSSNMRLVGIGRDANYSGGHNYDSSVSPALIEIGSTRYGHATLAYNETQDTLSILSKSSTNVLELVPEDGGYGLTKLTIVRAPSFTANVGKWNFNVQHPVGSAGAINFNAYNGVSINLADSDALEGSFHVKSNASTRKGVIVQAHASQTANLFEAQNSAGTTLFSVNKDGRVDAKQYTETSVNAFDTALSPSSGTLTVDVSSAGAVFGALDASVTTWAFTNVPTDNNKVTTVTVVLDGNASYTYGDACSVNGTAITDGVMWQDGSAPASTDGMDMVTFVIAKDSAGTVKVFGYGTTNFS